jgi:hypothetical protein
MAGVVLLVCLVHEGLLGRHPSPLGLGRASRARLPSVVRMAADDEPVPAAPPPPPPIDYSAAFAERVAKDKAEEAAQPLAAKMQRLAGDVVNKLGETGPNNGGLLSSGEWNGTLLFLGLVVVLACFSQISTMAGGQAVGIQATPGAYIR